MVDKVQNGPGLDAPTTIEDQGEKCDGKKRETFGCREISNQMCQIAPGTNVWLCNKCHEEMEEEQVR